MDNIVIFYIDVTLYNISFDSITDFYYKAKIGGRNPISRNK